MKASVYRGKHNIRVFEERDICPIYVVYFGEDRINIFYNPRAQSDSVNFAQGFEEALDMIQQGEIVL